MSNKDTNTETQEENRENGEVMEINPELKQMLGEIPTEDPFLTEYGSQKENPDNPHTDLIDKWMPESDDWQGKTIITAQQARALAVGRQLPELIPELSDDEYGVGHVLKDLIKDYEQYLTSIEGLSREQHVDVLQSVFGGPSNMEKENRTMLLRAFSDRVNDGDDE